MKKLLKIKGKAFTLIELMAVLIIIGLLALISVPLVTGILRRSREKSYDIQVETIIAEANRWVATNSFCLPSHQYDASCGVSVAQLIKEGLIDNKVFDPRDKSEMTGCVVISYLNTLPNGDIEYEYSYEQYCPIKNGTIIYFNPTTNQECSDYHVSNSNNGNVNGCMKWYAFGDTKTEVNLLLDHNITEISYHTFCSVVTKEVQTNDTTSWNSAIINTVRNITAEEIAKITGHPTFNQNPSAQDEFYFQTNTQTGSQACQSSCTFGWIYDRTSDSCKNNGCFNNSLGLADGYWTDSSTTGGIFRVMPSGNLNIAIVDSAAAEFTGTRPVITIQKSVLKLWETYNDQKPPPPPQVVTDPDIIIQGQCVNYEELITISFNANGGSGYMDDITVKAGWGIKIPPNMFSRTNHTFAGWNTKANGTGTAYSAGGTISCLEENTTLYAQFTRNAVGCGPGPIILPGW